VSLLKLTGLAFIIIILLINIERSSYEDHQDQDPTSSVSPHHAAAGESSIKEGKQIGKEKEELRDKDSLAGERVNGLPNITSNEKSPDAAKIEEMLEKMYDVNKNQAILNEELLGQISNSTTVIVIQVHNRLTYLRQLIHSLSVSRGISSSLIVFSHDIWDDEINSLVQSLTFAAVVQIFYPFSIQTHPSTFPGEEPGDCPRDIKPDKARSSSCTNAAWPDIHGHYREAKFTQTKHHWWWKTNHIFHNLKITKYFQGCVLFLEEDHYVSEDFLHVLGLMKLEQKRNSFGRVDILSLGTYLRKFNQKAKGQAVVGPQGVPWLGGPHLPLARNLKSSRHLLWAKAFINSLLSVFHKEKPAEEEIPKYFKIEKAEVGEWVSAKHNMGMALTRKEWDKISKCASTFCQYDDYNWDWSLQQVSNNCLKAKLQVMMIKGPRVFHIGECGVHHKKSDCDSNSVIEKVKSILQTAKEYLYPEKLSVVKSPLKKKTKIKKGNGGWGDKRDHALCLNMTVNY